MQATATYTNQLDQQRTAEHLYKKLQAMQR